jgi:hypothetical protein
VTVNNYPSLTVSGNLNVCAGAIVNLTAGGASSYNWNNNTTGATFTDTPLSSTVYTLTGSNGGSCTSTLTVNVTVDPCTGLAELTTGGELRIYPNPVKEMFTIKTDEPAILKIYNQLGMLIREDQLLVPGRQDIDVSAFSAGIYYAVLLNSSGKKVAQVIKIDQD